MARPREFDLEEAVETAMRLFWHRGFHQTTISDVERAVGIGRASVYAAFGDKDTLFLRALERYRDRYTLRSLAILERDGNPIAQLHDLFDALADRYADPATPFGCLVVVNAPLVSAEAPLVRDALAASLASGESRIAGTLGRAADMGLLASGTDIPAMASFLAATTQGMAATARLGGSAVRVRAIGRTALSVLKA